MILGKTVAIILVAWRIAIKTLARNSPYKYVRRQIFCLMKKRILNAQRIRIAHTSRRTEDARCKSKECEIKVQKKNKDAERESTRKAKRERERTVCKRYGKSSKQQQRRQQLKPGKA